MTDAEALGLPPEAFAKQDGGADLDFYAPPRLVTHIDPEFVLGLFSADIPEHVGGRDGDPSHNEADHR